MISMVVLLPREARDIEIPSLVEIVRKMFHRYGRIDAYKWRLGSRLVLHKVDDALIPDGLIADRVVALLRRCGLAHARRGLDGRAALHIFLDKARQGSGNTSDSKASS